MMTIAITMIPMTMVVMMPIIQMTMTTSIVIVTMMMTVMMTTFLQSHDIMFASLRTLPLVRRYLQTMAQTF